MLLSLLPAQVQLSLVLVSFKHCSSLISHLFSTVFEEDGRISEFIDTIRRILARRPVDSSSQANGSFTARIIRLFNELEQEGKLSIERAILLAFLTLQGNDRVQLSFKQYASGRSGNENVGFGKRVAHSHLAYCAFKPPFFRREFSPPSFLLLSSLFCSTD